MHYQSINGWYLKMYYIYVKEILKYSTAREIRRSV